MTKENWIKLGAGALILGVTGFLALFLIKSIVALAIVTFGALALWNFVPVFAQWASQMRVKGVKYLSAKNPVEDLQLIYIKKSEAINEAAAQIAKFATETKNYKDKLDEFKRKRPEKAETFNTTYDAMNSVLYRQQEKLRQSKRALVEFEGVISEAQDIWNMTQAAIKANSAMKNFEMPDPMDQIRQKTAFDSILNSLNEATAELETAVSLDYNTMIEQQPKQPAIGTSIQEYDFTSLQQEKVYQK